MASPSEAVQRATLLPPIARPLPILAPDARAEQREVLALFMLPPDHPLVAGHYPAHPIVPGTLLLEAALQAIEAEQGVAEGERLRIDDLQLLQPVLPGHEVEVRLRQARQPGSAAGAWQVSLSVAGRPVARARMTLAAPGEAPPAPRCAPTPAWETVSPLDVARSLPHRAPWLLVDRAWRAPEGDRLVAMRTVTLSDPCYAALRAEPAAAALDYPALLAAESFAQAAGLLLGHAGAQPPAPQVLLLGGARRIAFFGAAQPGDVLLHQLHLRRRFGAAALVGGSTYAGGHLVASTEDLLVTVRPAAPAAALDPSPEGNPDHAHAH